MKIALAQLNPTVGDLTGNTRLIENAISDARSQGAALVVFPELAVCGYPPRDLLHVEDFVQRCEDAARTIGSRATSGITAVIGTPLRNERGAVANGLLVYDNGIEIARYEKRLLPVYDVFDEDRYFEPGGESVVFEVNGRCVGLAVCEDLWRGEDAGAASRYANASDPIAALVDLGIDLLAVPSASPFVLGKHQRHRRIVASCAARLGAPIASVNQAGGNDDLVFDGRSCLITAQGRTLGEAAAFRADLLVLDLDGPPASDPGAIDPGAIDDECLLIEALTAGTRDYLGKCGFSGACVGLSGGIDSAFTAAIAVRALGAENVLGAAMPGPYSSDGSITDAYALAENLGMRCITMPIAPGLEGHRKTLDAAFGELGTHALGSQRPDVAEENLQSRVRGALMMGLSNRTGAMLLTTGNKSEVAVGYCTLYGDMNGGLAVISDVPKALVFKASRAMNERYGELGFRVPPIPRSTIEKPPSAELAPGQLDTDSLPPYEVLDAIVERHVEGRESAGRIARDTGFEAQLVARICRLIDLNEHKRRQYAVGLKVTSHAFGPGRRMPIAQRWNR